MLIGPYTLPNPPISNLDTIGLLAELGLVLLLFGIGLELGWRRIRGIGFQVLVIGIVEISVLTLLGVWIASLLPGVDDSLGLYLGGAIAISSSAILLKGLRDGGNLNSGWGQTIVGILSGGGLRRRNPAHRPGRSGHHRFGQIWQTRACWWRSWAFSASWHWFSALCWDRG